jgi:nucleoside-diphosphate-sugar epimerase
MLIIDVPPKAKSGESYTKKIRNLTPYIEQSGIKNVLFVSSTSVYADDNSIVTEDTIPNPDTESARQLVEMERLLQENQSFKTTILRFAGLISEDRHPVYHLAGRQNITNPDAPVNLIHRDDCIGIIKAIIEKEAWGQVFNGVAPLHPTRKDCYTQKANELGIELPLFNEATVSMGKLIQSNKILHMLHYSFKSSL